MDKFAFLDSLQFDEAPLHLSSYARALWYDAKGNWEKAHEIVQEIPGTKAAKIHAYLHRKERDLFNADYWYEKAGTCRSNVSLQKEWENLVDDFL